MDVMEHSLMGRLLLFLGAGIYNWYDGSILALLVRAVCALFKNYWHNSRIVSFFTREGAISRGWKHSIFAQLFGFILNLPGLLLRAIYRTFRPVFEGSTAARLGFGAVENTPIAAGWLMLLFFVIPYEFWNNAYSFMGFTVLLIFAILAGMRKSSRRLDIVAIGPYAIAFAGFVLLAWPLSLSSMLSQRFVFYHLSCMLCVLVIVSTVERLSQLKRLVGMVTFAILPMAGYAFLQRLSGIEANPSHVDMELNAGMPGRVYAMFDNPNAFGEVLVMLIPLAVALMFASRGWGGRFLGLVGAVLGTGSLIMTYSRAGWIGLLVAALVFLFLWNRKLLPIVIALGFVSVPLWPDAVLNRVLTIFNMKDTSTSSRFPLYQAALRLLEQHPIQGAGLGSDVVRATVKNTNLYYGEAPFVHSHNVYLQIWAETGLLGLLSFLASMGWAVKKGFKTVFGKQGSYPVRMIVIGGVSALLGILVCGIADFIWHYPRVMLMFWFVFAITLAGIRLALREEKAQIARGRRLER